MKPKKQSQAQLTTAASLALSRTRELSRLVLKLKQSLQEFSNLQPYDFFFFYPHFITNTAQICSFFRNQHCFWLCLLHHSVHFSFTDFNAICWVFKYLSLNLLSYLSCLFLSTKYCRRMCRESFFISVSG